MNGDMMRKLLGGGYLRGSHPIYLSYALTYECNGACDYCGANELGRQVMHIDQARNILRQFVDLGLSFITLTGGEPLLYPDLAELVEFLRESDVYVGLNTNGALVELHLDTLRQVQGVAVSLDGPKAAHDAARGEGTYDDAVNGVRLLTEAGIPTMVTAVLSSHNIDAPDAIVEEARRLGVEVSVQPVWGSMLDDGKAPDLLPDPRKMRESVRRLMELKEAGAPVANSDESLRHFLRWPGPRFSECISGSVTFRLEPDGQLTHCERMPGPPPNLDLKTMPVKTALKRMPAASCQYCWCAGQVELQLARDLSNRDLRTILHRSLERRA